MTYRISLRRTSLVIFGSRIASIFSGMLFLVMITGWLTPNRFGLWEVISTLVTLSSSPTGYLGFWATREIARGRLVGRTIVILNLALSLISTGAYLLVTLFSSSIFHAQMTPFVLALLLIPLTCWNSAANSIAYGRRPSALGYSLLVSEIGKLAIGYLALFILRLEIYGVILAVMASYIIQATATSLLVWPTLLEPVDLKAARNWVRRSWVPAIYSLGPVLATVDTVVASALYSTNLAGYYQAAFQIGSLVVYVNYLSYALYPLLLQGGSDEIPNATLDLVFMFGIPMSAGIISLAPQLLTLLSPSYVLSGANVSVPLAILGLVGLVTAVSNLIDSTLIGKERVDLQESISFASYARSHFGFVSGVNLAYAFSYIGSVSLEIYLGVEAGVPISTLVTGWALLQLVTLGIALGVKTRRVLKVVRLAYPRSLPLYLLSAIVMAGVVYLLGSVLLAPGINRFSYAIGTLEVIIVGAGFYFGLLLGVDSRLRGMARSFLHTYL